VNDNVTKTNDINSTLICVAIYERPSLAISCGGFDYAQGECYQLCQKGQIRKGVSCYNLCPKSMKEGGNICYLENYSANCSKDFIQGADRICIKPNSMRHNSTPLTKIQPLCPEGYVLDKHDCKLKCGEGYIGEEFTCRISCPSMYVARKRFCVRNLVPWIKNVTKNAAFNNSIPLCKKIVKIKTIGELIKKTEKPASHPSSIFLSKTRIDWKSSDQVARFYDTSSAKIWINQKDLNKTQFKLDGFYK
jgi:hypothetical protein